MKLLSITATLSLLVTLAQYCSSAEPAPAAIVEAAPASGIGPRIEFDSLVYDFGRVMAGQSVRHDFVFTNTGDATLEISGVHPSCGCTTAGAWTSKVEPGNTGTIPLVFNSGHFNGPIAKTASVQCNDRIHPQVTLQIRGTIWKPVEVNPSTAVLNVIMDSPSNPPATVTIVSSLPEPITLGTPVSNNRVFAAELKTIHPGKEFQLIISPVPPFTPGAVQGTISMLTSSTNMPTLDVVVVASIQAPWVVTPQEIHLPPGPLASAFTCVVSVQNNTGSHMTLPEATVNAIDVPVEIKEVMPGRQFALTLTFHAGFQVTQMEPVILTIKTSDPKNPIIKAPVRQNLLPNPHEIGLPGLHRGPVPPTRPQ